VTSSQEQVTVVVPYYNERENLPYLLQQLADQTYPPHEVILVNSGGNDGSSEVIDEWIAAHQPSVRFLNLNAGTKTPGGSKSAGVMASRGQVLAFMDCGLTFPKDWLARQVAILQNEGVDWVSGVCLTRGTSLVDKAAIAHTYGYMTARPVIPGSVVRRRVFDRIGLFKDLRAGYDAEWARDSERAGLQRNINREVVVEYRGVNFAADIRGVFLKSLRYARPSVGRDDTVVPYVYALGIVFGVVAVIGAVAGQVPPVWLPITAVLYLFARIVIASRKSSGLGSLSAHPLQFAVLCLVAIVMDAGKASGFAIGLFVRYILRRNLIT